MSEKPDPKNVPSIFRSAALSILIGSIALYLSVQLLQSIVLPLALVGGVFVAIWVVLLVRRLRRPEQW